ncbi:hypothetical protein V6N11_021273 [Hibiscus sabdariffa]|uniref:Uncharacterized protein n=1 Tax=Hibiscus sabdariffa TaxID=183260 RepID=A0ABR2NLY7_9ROSI
MVDDSARPFQDQLSYLPTRNKSPKEERAKQNLCKLRFLQDRLIQQDNFHQVYVKKKSLEFTMLVENSKSFKLSIISNTWTAFRRSSSVVTGSASRHLLSSSIARNRQR